MEAREKLKEIYPIVTKRILLQLKRDPVLFWEKNWGKHRLPVKSRNRELKREIADNADSSSLNSKQRIPCCDDIIEKMYLFPKVKHQNSKPDYCVMSDCITIPRRRSFRDAEAYYETLFHELIHATGHPMRLDRKELIDFYCEKSTCTEELIAEIGACYLKSYTGIREKHFLNSVAYIQDWLYGFYNDKQFILNVCKKAQQAVNYILVTGARQKGGGDG